MHSPEPLGLVEDVFGAEILGYSVLQITVGAFAIAGIIGGARWASNKALGKS